MGRQKLLLLKNSNHFCLQPCNASKFAPGLFRGSSFHKSCLSRVCSIRHTLGESVAHGLQPRFHARAPALDGSWLKGLSQTRVLDRDLLYTTLSSWVDENVIAVHTRKGAISFRGHSNYTPQPLGSLAWLEEGSEETRKPSSAAQILTSSQ